MTKFYQFLREILVFEEKWRKRAKYYTSFALCPKCAILGSKFRLVQFYHRVKGITLLKQAEQLMARPGLGSVNGVPIGIGGMLLFQ